MFVVMAAIVGSVSLVSASGCGNDHIEVGNRSAVTSRGANVRDVACMLGSNVIATLPAGTKIRVVGKTAWTQIVMADGRVGWIGNQFLTYTNDWNGVPAAVNNAAIGNYCDTTNPTRCMNPAPLGVTPTFSYNNNTSSNYTPPSNTTTATTTTTTPSEPPALTNTEKATRSALIVKFVERIENTYPDVDDQITEMKRVSMGLESLKSQTWKYKPLLEYLVELIDDTVVIKEMESLLDW